MYCSSIYQIFRLLNTYLILQIESLFFLNVTRAVNYIFAGLHKISFQRDRIINDFACLKDQIYANQKIKKNKSNKWLTFIV